MPHVLIYLKGTASAHKIATWILVVVVLVLLAVLMMVLSVLRKRRKGEQIQSTYNQPFILQY